MVLLLLCLLQLVLVVHGQQRGSQACRRGLHAQQQGLPACTAWPWVQLVLVLMLHAASGLQDAGHGDVWVVFVQ